MPSSYAQTSFSNGYEFTQGSGYVLPEYPFVAPPEIAAGRPGHSPYRHRRRRHHTA
jgi:3-(3-hydroxy-phenyl)propionate hydroxylase